TRFRLRSVFSRSWYTRSNSCKLPFSSTDSAHAGRSVSLEPIVFLGYLADEFSVVPEATEGCNRGASRDGRPRTSERGNEEGKSGEDGEVALEALAAVGLGVRDIVAEIHDEAHGPVQEDFDSHAEGEHRVPVRPQARFRRIH